MVIVAIMATTTAKKLGRADGCDHLAMSILYLNAHR